LKIEKFFPSDRLAPYIREYLLIDTHTGAESKTLPDTALVMAFRFRGNVLLREWNTTDSLPASTLAGLRKSVRHFVYQPMTSSLLVLFREGGLRHFTSLPPNELFGVTISNDNIFPSSEIEEILEQLAESDSNLMRIQLIESLLVSKLIMPKADPMIALALQRIRGANGMIRISKLADSLFVSQDPFEKRFRAVVGTSPKQFATIVRARNLIGKYSGENSLTSVAADAGYFDQSHFIRDFRSFTGESPKQFFRSASFW
jgi:AraC-like DNA-binding protein